MAEQKSKIFFIQMTENFFESEDLLTIKDIALDKNLDPIAFQMIYLKMILASLSNDGLIKTDGILTPQILKAKLRFSTNQDRKKDLETIDEAVKTFSALGLIVQCDNAIYVKKALELTMNKQEASQKRFLERRKNKNLIQELQLKQMNALSEAEKEELLFENKITDEWIPGLLYCGYCNKENQTEFISAFNELYESAVGIDEISQAMKIFVRRSIDLDFSKITDKKNYLYKTLYNITIDEVRSCSSVYDIIIDLLNRQKIIKGVGDLKNILGIFQRLERSGYGKNEIREASLSIISTNPSVLSDESFNLFAKELQEKLEAKKGGAA